MTPKNVKKRICLATDAQPSMPLVETSTVFDRLDSILFVAFHRSLTCLIHFFLDRQGQGLFHQRVITIIDPRGFVSLALGRFRY